MNQDTGLYIFLLYTLNYLDNQHWLYILVCNLAETLCTTVDTNTKGNLRNFDIESKDRTEKVCTDLSVSKVQVLEHLWIIHWS